MTDGIAYQNMDIEFKILSEHYKEKSFKAYGLDLPKIKAVLPTNMPVVKADEKRIDNLFLLEDDTLAIVDYESKDTLSNRVKYVNYIARVMEKYFIDEKKIPDIRLIIIYTGDVVSAADRLETTCFSLSIEQVFLKNLEGERIYQSIKLKLENNEELTEEELMQLIILPLTEIGKDKKQKRIEQVIELAKQMSEKEQLFIIAGILVGTDKFIDKKYAENVRGWFRMTKVGRLLSEESRLQEKKETAVKMLVDDMNLVQIMKYTGLSREEIEELKDEMLLGNK